MYQECAVISCSSTLTANMDGETLSRQLMDVQTPPNVNPFSPPSVNTSPLVQTIDTFNDHHLYQGCTRGVARNLFWGGTKLLNSFWNKFNNRPDVIVTLLGGYIYIYILLLIQPPSLHLCVVSDLTFNQCYRDEKKYKNLLPFHKFSQELASSDVTKEALNCTATLQQLTALLTQLVSLGTVIPKTSSADLSS